MIDEFNHERLQRRRAFLKSRAGAHLAADTNRRWHLASAATLSRDAAAVALLLDDTSDARDLLTESGDLFMELGFAGGLQLLYLAGALDSEDSDAQDRIGPFARAFTDRMRYPEGRPPAPDLARNFQDESFKPPQLLRAYQALARLRRDDETRLELRNTIRETLKY